VGLADAVCELNGVAGKVVVGKLQGVDEEARRLAVEATAANPGGHLGEGALDGGAVLESGEVEDGWFRLSTAGTGTVAGGMVVVAELLAAEGGRAAGAAAG